MKAKKYQMGGGTQTPRSRLQVAHDSKAEQKAFDEMIVKVCAKAYLKEKE
jgi:hypothetical protein